MVPNTEPLKKVVTLRNNRPCIPPMLSSKHRLGQVAEWSKARAWKVRRRETVSRVRIPSCPPQTIREHETRPQRGPFFLLFQRGLATPSDFRRLDVSPKLVSERPASLFTRPSFKSRRIKKIAILSAIWRIWVAPQLRRARPLSMQTETPEGGVFIGG